MEIRIKSEFNQNSMGKYVLAKEIMIDGDCANMTKAVNAAKKSDHASISDGNRIEQHFANCATIKSGILLDALKRALPFASKEEGDFWRFRQICGVRLDFTDNGAFCISASGIMLAKIRIDAICVNPFRLTIPNDFAKILLAVLQKKADGECVISSDGEFVRITGDCFDVSYSLKDDFLRYPNYNRVIPESVKKTYTFDVKAMKKAADAIIAEARPHSSLPSFEAAFSNHGISITYEDRERIDSVEPFVLNLTIPAKSTNSDIAVNFDAKFLRTVLSSVKTKKCTIGINEPLKITTFASQDDPDSLFLLMPRYPKYDY